MLAEALEKARNATGEARNGALESLGIMFEHERFDTAEAAPVVRELLKWIAVEGDRSTLEIMLNAVTNAIGHDAFDPRTVSLEPLVRIAPKLDPDLLGYVLNILGLSRLQAYRPVIERYVNNADASVQEAARDALAELGGA